MTWSLAEARSNTKTSTKSPDITRWQDEKPDRLHHYLKEVEIQPAEYSIQKRSRCI
ncbi:hypothetical protein DPMN_116304 [Dreissena polymorpha]|uniref:Uncharacterized protein n=1 Tax=Dreissena polymorpha TaxID=45954 RepID=A0A9D4KNG9_DREPO|nr:hypothetical protein DPMN_116304 [Dreissena polymorpha]